jgi:hypothetical protein
VGSTVRLYAKIEDALTGAMVRTGTKPQVIIVEPDGVQTTLPDANVDWLTTVNPKAFKAWSATAVFTPTKIGQHTAWWKTSAPYSGKADEKFWVYEAP